MVPTNRLRGGAALLAVTWIAACSERVPETQPPVQVPAGTPLSVVLDQALTTRIHRAGDPFVATVREAVVVSDRVVIEAGSSLQGRVKEAVSGARAETPLLTLAFTRVVDPAGVATPLELRPLRMEGAPPGAATAAVRSPALGDEIGDGPDPTAVATSDRNEIELPIGQKLVLEFAAPVPVTNAVATAGA